MTILKSFKRYWRIIKIVFYVSIPLTLIILPADFFDKGDSICLSKRFFDLECYACGMTKAAMHLIHLDFQTAWDYNKLIFITLPILSIWWLKLFLKEFDIHILKWF